MSATRARGAAAPQTAGAPPADSPRPRRRLAAPAILRRHLLVAAAVTAGILGALVTVEWALATSEADRVTRAAATRVAERVSTTLAATDFAQDSLDVTTLDGQLEGFFAAGAVARIKVWRIQGDVARVVYSDERRLIGDERPYSPDLAERLSREGVVVLDVPRNTEHRFETAHDGELREAFIAFTDAGGAPLRLEVYVPVFRDAWVASTLAVYVPVLVGGVALLLAALVPLSVRLARRLSEADVERRLAIDFGLRSRERERLRLARRLHDDVLQNLAGSALALDASASAPDPARLRAIAANLADDARALRSIVDGDVRALVPRLADALDDAVTSTRATGLTVRVDVDVEAEPDSDSSRLLVEAARELVRNAREHACAGVVRVEVGEAPDGLILEVRDDGRGIAPGSLSTGHGLRLLQRAFDDAGGDLTIDGDAEGTIVRARIPHPSHDAPGSWHPDSVDYQGLHRRDDSV